MTGATAGRRLDAARREHFAAAGLVAAEAFSYPTLDWTRTHGSDFTVRY